MLDDSVMTVPGLSTPLRPYQQCSVDRTLSEGNTMLALDMGTGKSLTALAVVLRRQCKRILIVCPLSVVGSWQNQFAEHVTTPYLFARLDQGSVRAKVEEAFKTVSSAARSEQLGVVAINYESLWREPFGSWALRAGFDCVIADESHRFGAANTSISQYMRKLGCTDAVRLCLTGTPFSHSPLSIFGQYRFLDDSIFGRRFRPFKERYALMGGYQGHQILGFQNQEELQRKFHKHAIVITKEEALPDLPPQVFEERVCRFEPKVRRQYDEMVRNFYVEVDGGEVTASNALTKLLRLQQLTSGHITTDDGESLWVSDHKAKLLADTLEDLTFPVVVFARFVRDLDVIRAVAEKRKVVYGEVSGRRKDLTPEAKMRPETDILAVQVQAGGVGIDLSRASTSIWYSMGYSLSDYEQALSRLHRHGQKQSVTHIHLITEGSVDRTVIRALAARKEVIQYILDRK